MNHLRKRFVFNLQLIGCSIADILPFEDRGGSISGRYRCDGGDDRGRRIQIVKGDLVRPRIPACVISGPDASGQVDENKSNGNKSSLVAQISLRRSTLRKHSSAIDRPGYGDDVIYVVNNP